MGSLEESSCLRARRAMTQVSGGKVADLGWRGTQLSSAPAGPGVLPSPPRSPATRSPKAVRRARGTPCCSLDASYTGLGLTFLAVLLLETVLAGRRLAPRLL